MYLKSSAACVSAIILTGLVSAVSAKAQTAATSVSAAQGASEPQRTTATFQDWLVQCRQTEMEPPAAAAAAADAKKAPAPVPAAAASKAAPVKVKICEMVQTFTFRQTGGQLAKIAIGKLPGEDKTKAVLQTPVGVHLPNGVNIKLDEKTEFKGAFVLCNAASCVADIELPRDAEQAFNTAKAATLTFTNGARQPITLSLSLKGFEGAFKSAMAQQQNR